MVHVPALPLQKDVQTAISISHPTLSQFFQTHPQLDFWIAPGLISVRSPPEAHGLASPTLRHLKNILIMSDNFATTNRLHHFFRSAS